MWEVRRTFHTDAPQLVDLVSDVDVFRRELLFRTPRLFRSDQHAALVGLPTGDELWRELLNRGPRQPAFRLVRAGDTTARPGVTRSIGVGNRTVDDAIDANRVIDNYRRGDTVVLQAIHQTNPWCAKLVTNLSLALDHPTQVNAYLSPPDQQGLDIHFDYHDVFVVQLAGTKRWRVWERLERSHDPLRKPLKIAAPKPDELGEPLMEFVMGTGDVLYLPRGYPHAAVATDEASDHLTIGLTAITWHRFYQHAIDVAARGGEYRASIPAGSLSATSDSIVPPDSTALAKALTERDYREWLARTIWKRMPQTRLRPRAATPADLADRPLDFTPGPLIWVTERDGQALLGLGDRVLRLPAEATGLLSELVTVDGTIDPTELTAVDAASRRVVLERLVNEGVLTPASYDASTAR